MEGEETIFLPVREIALDELEQIEQIEPKQQVRVLEMYSCFFKRPTFNN